MEELERLSKVKKHGLALVFTNVLEALSILASCIHQRVNTQTQEFTELEGAREGVGNGGADSHPQHTHMHT